MTIQKHAVLIGLPTVIWNIILSFLAFCDVLNLLYSHRNFCYIIDESTFKVYFHNKDSICSELAWRMFLKRNFEVLIKEVKHIFVYVNPAKKLHNNYRDYLFFNERVFSVEVQKSLSLYSIFMYLCFCKRSCDTKGKHYCTLRSKVPIQSYDNKVLFKEILIDWRKSLVFYTGHSVMSLSVFWNSNRWLKKFQAQKGEEFYRIKEPFKFFKMFLNTMVRTYVNKLIKILDKLNVSRHEYIFIRQRICWQAYDLMSQLCSETNCSVKYVLQKNIFLIVFSLRVIQLIISILQNEYY